MFGDSIKPHDVVAGIRRADALKNVAAEIAEAIPRMQPGDRIEVSRYADDAVPPILLTVTRGHIHPNEVKRGPR